jgi:hypothetical protein
MQHLAIVTADDPTSPAGESRPSAPGGALSESRPSAARQELAAAIERARGVDAQISECEAGLARCDAIIARVAPARAALEELEKADHERVREWAVAGAKGAPPARDEERIRALTTTWEKAKAEGDAAARARETILGTLRPHLVARDQEGAAIAALVRRVLLDEADALLAALADLERRRAALRGEVAGLMFHLQMEGLRGDLSATKQANDMRSRLARDPVETTDAEVKRATSRWADCQVSLRSDPNAKLNTEE